MRQDVQEILTKHNVQVELKGYKEMEAHEGYHMRGTLYVNGKKAIMFEDEGNGGEIHMDILNEKNASPLLDIQGDLATLKSYPDSDTIGELPYELDVMFYEMAEELLNKKAAKMTEDANSKQLLRDAKTKTLFMREGAEDDGYSFWVHAYDVPMLRHIVKDLIKTGNKTIKIWNETQSWVSYSHDDIVDLIAKKTA